MIYDVIQTPWGPFLLVADANGLCIADYQDGPKARAIDPSWHHDPRELERAGALLLDYLNGNIEHMAVPLNPKGTTFQHEVWEHLKTISYGQAQSYGQVARAMGRPQSTRAVASAIGRNPLQIFIPCHRVIGKNGDLRGYAGGLAMKERLLRLEGSLG